MHARATLVHMIDNLGGGSAALTGSSGLASGEQWSAYDKGIGGGPTSQRVQSASAARRSKHTVTVR